jgi:hypothetical protein
MSTKLERAPVEAPTERAAHLGKLTRLQRWTRGMGYAACAWALFFTLKHVYWVCGGSWLLGEANMRSAGSAFAQNPWRYVAGSVLLIALFAILALFPLALTWQGKHLTQRQVQWMAVLLGYLGMILMAAYSFATQEIMYGLASLGIGVLGGGVALVRPHRQSVERWLVLVATWLFGAGMTIYGCSYIVLALLNMHAAYFLEYLVGGGMNWTIEGLLFVSVAWLASSRERFASRTLTSQPARRSGGVGKRRFGWKKNHDTTWNVALCQNHEHADKQSECSSCT